jgi:hypothetical protein
VLWGRPPPVSPATEHDPNTDPPPRAGVRNGQVSPSRGLDAYSLLMTAPALSSRVGRCNSRWARRLGMHHRDAQCFAPLLTFSCPLFFYLSDPLSDPLPLAPWPRPTWANPGSRLLDDLLLAPFLTTRDLLSLSATAIWLRPYRTLLRDIKIKEWRDDVAPAVLRDQRHLHTLHVGSVEVLGRPAVSLRGDEEASPGVTLRRLILEWDETRRLHRETTV